MYECIKFTVDSNVAVLTFNRPEQRNAISRKMKEEIMAALQESAESSEINVLVIAAEGKSFCAGRDVEEIKKNAELPLIEIYKDYASLKEFTDAFASFPKPLIAAVNGHALGLGSSLITYCDLVVANEGALFGLPELEMNIVPGIASVNVAKVVNKRKLSEMILLGKKYSAREALDMGLINEVAPDGKAVEVALGWAGKLAKLDRWAVALSKQFINRLNQGAPYDFEAFSSLGLMGVGFANKNHR